MIILLHPSLLPWLLAASVPLVVHLLTRRTRRRVEIPTVQFLQRSIAQQSQVYKWRHWLLLLLRTLAIAALVIAFTRPTLNAPIGAPPSGHDGIVLVLDTSASMGYTETGLSTMSHARDAAIQILTGLPAGADANVVFCDAHPHPAESEPVKDVASLVHQVRAIQPTEERADPNGALNIAVEQIGKSKSGHKRIIVLSDFQRSNWADVKFESVPSGVTMSFLSAAQNGRANAGITSIRLTPATPRIGDPVSVECEVFNSSSAPRSLPVTLALTGGDKQVRTVALEPYSSATASFTMQFDTPRLIECTASLPDDGLSADNSRRIVIDLQKTPSILLITDEDVTRPTGAAFFVAHALHPNASSAAGFRVVPVKPAALTSAALHAADAVIVCNAPQMPPVQYEALTKYATGGGNLIWFLYGDRIADQINAMAKLMPGTEPMPLQIDHVDDLTGNGKGYVSLAEAHYESPLLKAFKDPGAADLTRIRFRKICVTGEVDPRAETLLKFDDGTCAAVHTVEGSGNLLLINMSPAPGWSDLAGQPAFLPLMHEFIKGLLSKNATAPEFIAGGSAAASIPPESVPAAGRVACFGPDGDVPVTADTTTGSVVVDSVTRGGFYHVTAASTPIATLAVNTHADETDLRAIDPLELETQQKRASSYFASVSAGNSLDPVDRGRPLWQYFLAAALLCLFGEQCVASLTPRARSAKR